MAERGRLILCQQYVHGFLFDSWKKLLIYYTGILRNIKKIQCLQLSCIAKLMIYIMLGSISSILIHAYFYQN